MERLTDKKEADAQRREYENRLANGYPRNIPEERFLKLAAYEDTGLDPDDISVIQTCEQGFAEMLVQVSCGCAVPYSRLVELAQAEKDGRLVVVPCKAGDLLYEVDLPEYGVITCKVLYVSTYNGHAAHVKENPVVSAVSVGVEVVEGHGKGSGYNFETQDFGKLVFLTREEAEAALKKMEADNEAN